MTNLNKNVLILGIGNLLWADEGFGVRAVEAFNQKFEFPDSMKDQVRLMDGGTQGMYLVPYVQETDLLIVFDAIDYGLASGTIKVIKDDEVPSFMGAKKMSLHQTGFQEVLATSQLLGQYPEHILLVGVQPVDIDDYGGSLRLQVKEQIQPAIEIARAWLHQQGIPVMKRECPLPEDQGLSDSSLGIQDYESQRPSAADACRGGDMRILQSESFRFDPKPAEQQVNMSVNIDQRVQSPPTRVANRRTEQES